VFDYLIQQNVSGIVIEELKIKQHHDTDKRFNRFTNNFCSKKISEKILRNALKMGFQIKKVNPAYTSVIGRFKYMKKHGISVHEAASFVIGRRGMCFK
jgi:IS605 OrfB family transposase